MALNRRRVGLYPKRDVGIFLRCHCDGVDTANTSSDQCVDRVGPAESLQGMVRFIEVLVR